MLIHNPIFTGSISLNGADISQISTVSSDSSSFASRITNTESTASAYVLASGSFSTRVTLAEATASALVTASSSFSARIASNEAKTGSFATTGSNQFNGSQTVTGSLTATGTIVAQTLVVQTITASVEFVTGSNRFGTTTGNTHEFTGSLLVSGSQIVNGNVGIGITNPSEKLTVNGALESTADGFSSEGGQLILRGTTYRYNIDNLNGQALRFFREDDSTKGGGTVLMYVSASGNIGMGTTNPYTKLDVAGSISINGRPVIDNSSAELYIGGITGVSGRGTDVVALYTANTERMRITSGGNVGIGTTSPNAYTNLIALTINGTLGSVLDFATGGTTYGEIYSLANEMRVDAIGASSTLKLLTNSSTRMSITSVGNFDYGGFNVQTSNNSVYRQAFWGPMSIMWRNAEDAYINSNHTYGSSNTNVATYASSNGIGRLSIYGGNLEWGSYNGSVSAGTAYTLSSRFIVTKAGSVGIGTDNPIDTLNVIGNVRVGTGNSFKASYDGGNNNYHGALSWATLQLGNNGDNRIIGGRTAAGGNLKFYVNNTNDATNYATAPDGTLALTLASTGIATFTNSITTNQGLTVARNLIAGETTPLHLNYTTSDGNAPAIRLGSGTQGFWDVQPNNNNTRISFDWNDSLNVLNLLSSGNVGIGTTSPSFALDIASTSADSLRINRTGVGGTGSASSISFQVTQTNSQSATLCAISAEFMSNWGGDLRFYTKPSNGTPNNSVTEYMRLTSAGNLLIGTTTESLECNLALGAKSTIEGGQMVLQKGASYTYATHFDNYGDTFRLLYGTNTGTTGINFTVFHPSGNYQFSGSNTSDRRLKTNINTLSLNAIEKINALISKSYNMIANPEITRYGFIAQEVQEILPDLITGTESENDVLGLDYNGILAVLVKAVQELSAKVAALEAQQ